MVCHYFLSFSSLVAVAGNNAAANSSHPLRFGNNACDSSHESITYFLQFYCHMRPVHMSGHCYCRVFIALDW